MAHLTPNDVVPALRNNLAFSHSPHGLGTGFVSVKNVTNGEEFRLRGFECSLARMLNGRRTAAELVKAAEQVGLPVTLEDLDGFLKKLEDRHLVTASPGIPEKDDLSPFEGRQPWDDKTRRLYRLALREGRTGNINRALMSLDCLLHERPDVDEAVHLRERLEVRQVAPEYVAPFKTVFAQTEFDWQSAPEVEVEPRPDRRRVGLIVAGVFAALGALVLLASLIPFPHTVKQTATLLPIASAKVTVPRAGTIATVPVAVGQWVDKDTVLYTLDVTAPLAQLEGAVGRLEVLNRQLYTHLPQTKEVKAARTRYVQAEAKLAAAQSLLESERVRDGDRVIEAEESLNWALQEITDARMALDEKVPEPQQVALRAQRNEVQELEMVLLQSEVTAPISGVITLLAVQPGVEVVKGLTAAQLDDTRKLKGVALVAPRDRQGLAAGQPVLLLANDRATNTTVTSTSGRTVEFLVDNDARTFQPGAAQVQIRGNPVPLIR